jgi:Rrf2 family protein
VASILSNPCKYALQALVHLARRADEGPVPLREVAEEEGIPNSFLAKVMQQLARMKMLRSSKGPGGGFAFRRSPGEITVRDVIEAVDGLDAMESCVMHSEPCDESNTCPLHEGWATVQDRINLLIESTTLADLADGGIRPKVLRSLGPLRRGSRQR